MKPKVTKIHKPTKKAVKAAAITATATALRGRLGSAPLVSAPLVSAPIAAPKKRTAKA